MKRNLTIAIASIALAVPAIALGHGGAHAVYEGPLVDARDSAVKLKVFTVRNYDVQCKGGVPGTLKRTKLTGTSPVDKAGDFKSRGNNGRTTVKLAGHIGRNKATGTFRITGRLKADNGQTLDCDSGKLEWKVRP